MTNYDYDKMREFLINYFRSYPLGLSQHYVQIIEDAEDDSLPRLASENLIDLSLFEIKDEKEP